jgi:hypothetical protein
VTFTDVLFYLLPAGIRAAIAASSGRPSQWSPSTGEFHQLIPFRFVQILGNDFGPGLHFQNKTVGSYGILASSLDALLSPRAGQFFVTSN